MGITCNNTKGERYHTKLEPFVLNVFIEHGDYLSTILFHTSFRIDSAIMLRLFQWRIYRAGYDITEKSLGCAGLVGIILHVSIIQ